MTYPDSQDKRPGSYVFDRFRLSDDGTLLLERGAALAVAPKVLQTLLVLVQRAGQVVTKDDLVQAVWPDTIVEETGLTRNISVLRQTLGDDGQRFVATIPRIGYRFVAAVNHVESVSPGQGQYFEPVPKKSGPAETRRPRERLTVGHRQERAQLDAAFASTQEGSGKLIAVCGEPGIGKTTIVQEFLSDLAEPCLVGQGRCSERLAGAEPHLAILEALDELFAQDSTLAGLLRRLAPTWYVHVAPRFGDGSLKSPLPEQAPSGSADRLMRELTVFLEEISRTRPVVISIDDLHWSDVSTVDLIAHLAARLTRMRVMLIIAYRANEMMATNHPFSRLRGDLVGRGQLTEIAVSLLTFQDVREYLLSLLSKADVPPELPPLVYHKTEGHPLFMTDLVRYLQEHGLPEGGAVEVTRAVPESLKGMIERTLRALNSDTQHLLRVSSLHGNEFESAIIAAVTGRHPVEIEEQLQTLARVHGLVTIVREHSLPDGTFSLRCRFVHVLYQNALFASTTPSRRAEWAGRIAERLAAAYAARTELIASELAVLFEIAREFRKASQYFLTASRTASGRFAYREACDLAKRGLECLRTARIETNEDTRRLEVDLTFALFMPLASIQGYGSPEVETLLQHLLQLCEGTQDSAVTGAALSATWIVRMVRGECVAAKDAGSRLISLARSARDAILLMNGHSQVEIACHHMGEFREAQAHADAAIALDPVERYSERRLLSILDPVVAALAESSRNLAIMGYFKRATEDCERAVEIGRRIGHPDSFAFAWFFHGVNRGFRRDWKASLKSADAGISIASEADSVQTLAWNRCVRGWALAHMGRVDEGLEDLTAAIESSRRIMGQVGFPQQIVMRAEALLLKGDVDSALQSLAQALELSHRQFDRYFDAELHRLTAVCLLGKGEREAASTRLRSALDVAKAQEAATFELRAALTLAEYDLDGWRDVLSSTLAQFPDAELWPEIHDARRFLR
jgi:DNA-binding winged helix-turn-helix (wHTH) protein/tetratricopeptide (TPR) repeat protein